MDWKYAATALLTLAAVSVLGQEVRFIDMTALPPRTQLRYPPSPPPKCDSDGHCIAGGFGGGSVADGAADVRDPHALALYVLSLPERIDCSREVMVEFRLLNTGVAPIDVPISPDLSGLQPANDAETFDYDSIDLAARERATDRVGVYGALTLYGAPSHANTILTLKPGEWIRVRGNIKWLFTPARPGKAALDPVFTLRVTTYIPHPGGSSSSTRNLYPNHTPTPGRDVVFVASDGATKASAP